MWRCRDGSQNKTPQSNGGDAARREALRLKQTRRPLGISGRIAQTFLESKLTPLLVVASLLVGAFAVMVTPREEEPQIKVPMIDVFVGLPGATAQEVERRVISPLEKAIYEIDNVDYIYSITQPSGGMIIVRFLVGTDPDQAVVRVHTKVAEVTAQLPRRTPCRRSLRPAASTTSRSWPTPSGPRTPTRSQLRQVAQELKIELTRHPRVAQVSVIGGQRRAVQVQFDRERLAAHHVSLLQVYQALAGLNWRLPAGIALPARTPSTAGGESAASSVSADDVASAVVGVYGGRPVYLRDVADGHRRSRRAGRLRLDARRGRGRRETTCQPGSTPRPSPWRWPRSRAPTPSSW